MMQLQAACNAREQCWGKPPDSQIAAVKSYSSRAFQLSVRNGFQVQSMLLYITASAELQSKAASWDLTWACSTCQCCSLE